MKQKTFYLAIAFLITIMLIVNILGRKMAYVPPVSKETLPEPSRFITPQAQSRKLAQPGLPRQPEGSAVNMPAGVTIIKPAETPATVFEEETVKTKGTKETTVQPLPSKATTPKGAVTPKPSRPAPGVTEINKQPSEETKKTMRERGIIMY